MNTLKDQFNMINNSLIKKTKRLMWALGFDIRRAHHALPIDLSKKLCFNPIKLAYVANNREILIKVPIEKCIHFDWGAFKSSKDSPSPYIQTLIDFKNKDHTIAKGSKLETFYNQFQPKNMVEYMRLGKVDNTSLYSIGPFGAIYPWLDENPAEKEKYIQSYLLKGHIIGKEKFYLDDGDQFFGPVSNKKLQHEFMRLTSVYKSIKKAVLSKKITRALWEQ